MAQKIEALYISDVHLGSRGTAAEPLLEVLKRYRPDRLYIVGDFIDGWLLKKRHYWPQSHSNVIRKVLSYAKKGVQVYYITGNHDDFLRAYDLNSFGNIQILDEVTHDGVWITHGDLYDTIVMYNRWLAVLGSAGYELSLRINKIYSWIRKALGLRPRSFSKWIKHRVKSAVAFMDKFEETLALEANTRGCHTVICGHIHNPTDVQIHGIRYLNTGDWIESLSYITLEGGEFKLHHYEPC